MDFFDRNCVIDLEKLKATEYPSFSGEFEEDIDEALLHLILADEEDITEKVLEDQWTEDGDVVSVEVDYKVEGVLQQHPLFPKQAKNEVKKILKNMINKNKNKVFYAGARGGFGRRYARYAGTYEDGMPKPTYEGQHSNPSLTTVAKKIRNTLYSYLGYKDFDFQASHFTIALKLGEMLRLPTKFLDEWINNKQAKIDELIAYHSVEGKPQLDKSAIKDLVSSALFGGGIKKWGEKMRKGDLKKGKFPKEVRNVGDTYDRPQDAWRDEHEFFSNLKKEITKIRDVLYAKNPDFAKAILSPKKSTEYEKKSSFFSYFLGVIENHCLHIAHAYFVRYGVIKPNTACLAYDGFTAIPNPNPTEDNPTKDFSTQELTSICKDCSENIYRRTAFPMKLVLKEFDEETIITDIINLRNLVEEDFNGEMVKWDPDNFDHVMGNIPTFEFLDEDASWVAPPVLKRGQTAPSPSSPDRSLLEVVSSNINSPVISNNDATVEEQVMNQPDLERGRSAPSALENQEEHPSVISSNLDGMMYDEPALSHPVYQRWKNKFEYGRFQHFKVRFPLNFICYTQAKDTKKPKITMMSKTDLRENYQNQDRFEMEYEVNGKVRCKVFTPIELWFLDPDMRTYNNIVNLPHGKIKAEEDEFNSYFPSRFFGKQIGMDHPDYNAEAVRTFLKHIKITCNHEEEPSEFFTKWIASYIQNPQTKGSHIYITGQTGTGKNTLTNALSHLIGGHTLETTNPERDVWGDFNMLMCNANLVVLNEVNKKNSHNAEGRIKGLITDSELQINGKGKDAFTITSFHRFITLTNTADPVNTGTQDRRNMITEMSPELRNNKAYWNNWYNGKDGVMSERGLLSIYSYFWNVELGDFNPQPQPEDMPITSHHRHILNNRPYLQQFLIDFVCDMWNNRKDDLESNYLGRMKPDVRRQCFNLTKRFDNHELQGFVMLSGTEFFEYFNNWARTKGNRGEEFIKDKGNLGKKIKGEVIRDLDLDRNEVCASQRQTTGNAEITFWDIYTIRNRFFERGILDRDEDEIVGQGQVHPSLINAVSGFNPATPPSAGGGLNNMNDMIDALDESNEDDLDLRSGDDDDSDSDNEELLALQRKLAEMKAKKKAKKEKKEKKKAELANMTLDNHLVPDPTPPTTPVVENTRIRMEVQETFKTPEPTVVSSAGNTSNEKRSPEPEEPEVKKTFGNTSPRTIKDAVPAYGSMIWNRLTGKMDDPQN